MARSPDIAFIAWTREDSRARSLAKAFDGELCALFDLRIQGRLVPLRYLLSAVRTCAYLLRRRPRAVVVQSPPIPAVALVWAWARLARVPVVVDTHPASFETTGIDRAMRPVLAWLVPRTAACLVTTPGLGAQVKQWGGRWLVLHEPPNDWSDRLQARPCSPQRRLLFICTFAPDEPLMPVLEAARSLPDIEFRITGEHFKIPAQARRSAPANVRWVGYLRGADFVAALEDADVVMSLSSRTDSVQRSAHEAVDALRPLVLSDAPHMHELFPYAVHVGNDVGSLTAGIADAFARCAELSAAAEAAREAQWRRWDTQSAELRRIAGLTHSGG